jgi:hypothetical protein
MILGIHEKQMTTKLVKQFPAIYGMTDQLMLLSLPEKLTATQLVTQPLGL